jgi:hypothetical protein
MKSREHYFTFEGLHFIRIQCVLCEIWCKCNEEGNRDQRNLGEAVIVVGLDLQASKRFDSPFNSRSAVS